MTTDSATDTAPDAPSERPTDKFVAVLADDLPAGLAVNAGALLGISLGRLFPHMVGPDVVDASGTTHLGLSTRTLPILTAPRDRLADLAGRARATGQVTAVGLTRTAQQARTYPEYTRRLAALPTARQVVIGLALHGPQAAVTSLTGDLPLYR